MFQSYEYPSGYRDEKLKTVVLPAILLFAVFKVPSFSVQKCIIEAIKGIYNVGIVIALIEFR